MKLAGDILKIFYKPVDNNIKILYNLVRSETEP